jgi:preprotein translocase subunit YajC
VTTSGIIGLVSAVREKSLTIKSDDSKMEITKASVGEVLERSSSESSES